MGMALILSCKTIRIIWYFLLPFTC